MARTASPSPRRTPSQRSNKGVAPAKFSPDATAKASPAKKAAASSSPASSSAILSAVGPADVIVLMFSISVWLYVMKSFGVPLFVPPSSLLTPLAVVAGVSPSQLLLYPSVWYNAKKFAKACKKRKWKPVSVFAKLVAVGKTLQQVALFYWASGGTLAGLTSLFTSASPTQWAAFAVLFTIGQGLNASIYRAIGADGVYYGFKLGAPVPWSTAFPFSAGFRHPQYVGGYSTQLGIFALVASKPLIAAGLVPLALWWAALYVLNSAIEASDDNDA